MSQSLSKSLHDFFESQSRTKDESFLKSVDYVPSAGRLPKQLDDLVKSEQQTLSNDKLIEGYVVIKLEDEKNSSIQSSGKFKDRNDSIDINTKSFYEGSNNFVEETNSSLEDERHISVDTLTSISEVKNVENMDITNIQEGVSVSDYVKSVKNNYGEDKEGSIESGDSCSDGVVTSTNSKGERKFLVKNAERIINMGTVIENRIHSDNESCKGEEDQPTPVSELTREKSPTDHEKCDRDDPIFLNEKNATAHNIKCLKHNQDLYEKETENLQNFTKIRSMHSRLNSKGASDIDNNTDEFLNSDIKIDDSPFQDVPDDDSQFGKNVTGESFIVQCTKLGVDKKRRNTDKDYDLDDGVYDECGSDFCDLDEDNKDNGDEDNKSNDDEYIVSSDDTDDDNSGSQSDAYESCDECTDDEYEQINTERDRESIENLTRKNNMKVSSVTQTEKEEKSKHFKENDGECIKIDLPKVINHRLTPLIRNRSCFTDDPLDVKIKPDALNKVHNTQVFIRVPSGVLGDGVRPEGLVLSHENNIGDDTPVTVDSMSRLHHYSAELECPTATTGKITETPRYSSVVQELASRAQSGAATELSNVSGRKNPQAKLDSEVRDLERKARIAQSAKINSIKRALPPIKRDRRPIDGRLKSGETATCTTRKIEKDQTTVCGVKSQRKSAVPRLLQSSVCYHDGKVDVSIYSERGLINQSDPVHLNINFIRQPLGPATIVKSAINKPNGVTKAGLPSRTAQGGVTKDRSLNRKARTSHVTRKNFPKLLSPIENPPKLQSPKMVEKQVKNDVRKKSTYNRKKGIPSRCKNLTNIWSSKFDDIDWNIVERRAQKPPFNTHIDPDASQRHIKFFMDF